MGDNTREIERHINERRSRLSQDINELEQKAQDVLDWRLQMERHPGTMLGLAFGAGILISAVLSGPGRRTRCVADTERDAYGAPKASAVKGAAGGAWDKIKDALLAAALVKVEGVVREVLPEFDLGENKTEFEDRVKAKGD